MKDILVNVFGLNNYLDEESINLVAETSQEVTLSKGELIQRSQDDCNGIPFVVEGNLRLYKLSKQGREMNIHRIAAGEICILATLCIFTDIDYDFSVAAETDTKLILVNPMTFNTIVERNPKFNRFIISLISNKLINSLLLHEKVHLSSIEERLTEYLVENASNGVIRKTHEEIACDIGSSRVVISRAIAKLRKENKITTQRHEIHINQI